MHVRKSSLSFYLVRFIFYLDMTIAKYNSCFYNFMHQLPIAFSTLAYLTYIGNWFRLCVALAFDRHPVGWKYYVFKWSKPVIYGFVIVNLVYTFTTVSIYCHRPPPVWMYIVLDFGKVAVLILAALTGPVILKLMKQSSKYFYEKTRYRVSALISPSRSTSPLS